MPSDPALLIMHTQQKVHSVKVRALRPSCRASKFSRRCMNMRRRRSGDPEVCAVGRGVLMARYKGEVRIECKGLRTRQPRPVVVNILTIFIRITRRCHISSGRVAPSSYGHRCFIVEIGDALGQIFQAVSEN